MNKARRKKIREALDLLQQVGEIIAVVGDEEDEAFDNMPEALQESERGQQMEEYIETIDYAITVIEELKDDLEKIAED